MSAPGEYVIDGGGLACLGLPFPDLGRLADLRRPLAVALEIERAGGRFLCYLDRNLPYRVREEDRGLLDLLLAEHGERFPTVPPRTDVEDYLLQRAGPAGAALVTAVPLSGDAGHAERYPWLRHPGRHLLASQEDGLIRLGDAVAADYGRASAFDLYDDLLHTLSRP